MAPPLPSGAEQLSNVDEYKVTFPRIFAKFLIYEMAPPFPFSFVFVQFIKLHSIIVRVSLEI